MVADAAVITANVTDRWIPDAIAIAAVKHSPELALTLLRRNIPGNMTNNAQYLTGMRSVVQLMARNLAVNQDVEALIQLMEAVPTARPEIAIGVFAGIAGPGGGGGRGGGGGGAGAQAGPAQPPADPPFRAGDWNNQQLPGWPQGEVAVLTPAQQARIVAAARASAAEHAPRFTRVAERMGVGFILPAPAAEPAPAAAPAGN
jgi:hypothetical protein